MNTSIQTLTQVQEDAVAYALRAARPNDLRVKRKMARMVRTYCETHGYSVEQTAAAMRDVYDTVDLQRNAE